MKNNVLITIDKKTLKTLSDEAQELLSYAVRFAASEVYSGATGNLIEAEEVHLDDKYIDFDISIKAHIDDITNEFFD